MKLIPKNKKKQEILVEVIHRDEGDMNQHKSKNSPTSSLSLNHTQVRMALSRLGSYIDLSKSKSNANIFQIMMKKYKYKHL